MATVVKSETLPCIHCGTETAVVDCSTDKVFCCNGCRAAYQLIGDWGLSDFYALRDRPENSSNRVNDQSRFEHFDNEEFLGMSAPKKIEGDLLETRLAIHGLHCGACVWLIENIAARTSGWKIARVNLSNHSITIVFDPAVVSLSNIARTIAQVGYEISPIVADGDAELRSRNRQLLADIAIAGFFAANAMWIAIALYAGESLGIKASYHSFLTLVGCMLGACSVLGPGRVFFRGAGAALRAGVPHMDMPIALGLSVGVVGGLINVIMDSGAVYFDSVAILVFLLLIGRWIQFRQQHRAAKSVDLLTRLTPQHATVVTPQGTKMVLAQSLTNLDIVRVSPGEPFPADGTVTDGTSTINRSLLTGESDPVKVIVGDEVVAGAVNLSRPLDIQVTAAGLDTRIGHVMQAVEDAASTKTPIVQFADRIGGVFVIFVTVLSVITFSLWISTSWIRAVEYSTALLIVACPCALALATPLAIAVSLGQAAKRKILIQSGDAFQRLSKPGLMWFDKTGTLTEGRPRVVKTIGNPHAVRFAAAVEQRVVHPIAQCIINESRRQEFPDWIATEVEVDDGGVRGTCHGRSVSVGNRAFIERNNISIGQSIRHEMDSVLSDGESYVLVALDEIVESMLVIVDPVKPNAKHSIDSLRQLGWKIGIASGDQQSTVDGIAARLSVDEAYGNLTPESKVELVDEDTNHGSNTVMIGDGANDAAALARADVGIALRGGAEVSLKAAPIYLGTGDLESIVQLVQASRRSKQLIFATLSVSLAYNCVAIGLAITGMISPLIAAVLMPISSISVLTVTLCWPIFPRGAKA